MSINTINVLNEVLGIGDDTCFMRHSKRTRNPDVFTYDSSRDYKEDFGLVQESFCDCGCKSAVYTKEQWTGDGYDTQVITQTEYEELPSKPKPTKEQIKLQTDIINADREETESGIIHGQKSCGYIPVPKLEFKIPK